MVSNTGASSPGEPEMTFSTSDVAACRSNASERRPRASASSRVRASSCFFNPITELGSLLTRALAFVPVERSLRPRVGLFAPLRDKVTSSAPLVDLCWLLQTSLDHLVGKQKERFRDREPKCLCGPKVHDQFKLRRLLHGQVGWPRALQNLVHIAGSASDQIGRIR